jgi:hypothetical protein
VYDDSGKAGVPGYLMACADSEPPIPQSVRYVVVLATPVLLVARPRLGCAVAVISAALLGIAGEPSLVVVPFAVNAMFCAYFLVRPS